MELQSKQLGRPIGQVSSELNTVSLEMVTLVMAVAASAPSTNDATAAAATRPFQGRVAFGPNKNSSSATMMTMSCGR